MHHSMSVREQNPKDHPIDIVHPIKLTMEISHIIIVLECMLYRAMATFHISHFWTFIKTALYKTVCVM